MPGHLRYYQTQPLSNIEHLSFLIVILTISKDFAIWIKLNNYYYRYKSALVIQMNFWKSDQSITAFYLLAKCFCSLCWREQYYDCLVHGLPSQHLYLCLGEFVGGLKCDGKWHCSCQSRITVLAMVLNHSPLGIILVSYHIQTGRIMLQYIALMDPFSQGSDAFMWSPQVSIS